MSAHTPGPWEWVTSKNYGYACLNAPSGEVLYPNGINGDSPITWMGEEMSEADACLIAAAPDLLEALKEVVKLANEIHGHWYDDKEAKVGKCLRALAQRLPKYDTRIDKIHAAIAKAEGGAA